MGSSTMKIGQVNNYLKITTEEDKRNIFQSLFKFEPMQPYIYYHIIIIQQISESED